MLLFKVGIVFLINVHDGLWTLADANFGEKVSHIVTLLFLEYSLLKRANHKISIRSLPQDIMN